MSNEEIFHELTTIAYATENQLKFIVSDFNRLEALWVITKYNDLISHH